MLVFRTLDLVRTSNINEYISERYTLAYRRYRARGYSAHTTVKYTPASCVVTRRGNCTLHRSIFGPLRSVTAKYLLQHRQLRSRPLVGSGGGLM